MTTTLTRPVTPAISTTPAAAQPRWTRPALIMLLAGTAVLYLWDLSGSGWAS